MILRIDSEPVRYLYRDARDLAYIPSMAARHAVLESAGEIASAAGGENANVGVVLRDCSETYELLVIPPLGCTAALIDGADELFVGIVQGASVGDAPGLSIEA